MDMAIRTTSSASTLEQETMGKHPHFNSASCMTSSHSFLERDSKFAINRYMSSQQDVPGIYSGLEPQPGQSHDRHDHQAHIPLAEEAKSRVDPNDYTWYDKNALFERRSTHRKMTSGPSQPKLVDTETGTTARELISSQSPIPRRSATASSLPTGSQSPPSSDGSHCMEVDSRLCELSDELKVALKRAQMDLMEHAMLAFGEFWRVAETDADMREVYNGSSSSRSSGASREKPKSQGSSSLGKRKWVEGTDQDQQSDNEDAESPEQDENRSPAVGESLGRLQLACPFRKHNPRIYNVSARAWMSCAHTPMESAARVKTHLYERHMIYQCLRCKDTFESQECLVSHANVKQGCEVKPEKRMEGVTLPMQLKLKCRKKKEKNSRQSEEDKWCDIYRLLFPGESVPSPYFVQGREAFESDNSVQSYNEFAKTEVPRLLRDALQDIIQTQFLQIEEGLMVQLPSMVQKCQDVALANYEALASDAPSTFDATESAHNHSALSLDCLTTPPSSSISHGTPEIRSHTQVVPSEDIGLHNDVQAAPSQEFEWSLDDFLRTIPDDDATEETGDHCNYSFDQYNISSWDFRNTYGVEEGKMSGQNTKTLRGVPRIMPEWTEISDDIPWSSFFVPD